MVIGPHLSDDGATRLSQIADNEGRYVASRYLLLIGAWVFVPGLIGLWRVFRGPRVMLGQVGAGLCLIGWISTISFFGLGAYEYEAAQPHLDRAPMSRLADDVSGSGVMIPMIIHHLRPRDRDREPDRRVVAVAAPAGSPLVASGPRRLDDPRHPRGQRRPERHRVPDSARLVSSCSRCPTISGTWWAGLPASRMRHPARPGRDLPESAGSAGESDGEKRALVRATFAPARFGGAVAERPR
ncbi:MAG: hypothetical protein ACXVY5_06965 [Gaiellales bacterium]